MGWVITPWLGPQKYSQVSYISLIILVHFNESDNKIIYAVNVYWALHKWPVIAPASNDRANQGLIMFPGGARYIRILVRPIFCLFTFCVYIIFIWGRCSLIYD